MLRRLTGQRVGAVAQVAADQFGWQRALDRQVDGIDLVRDRREVTGHVLGNYAKSEIEVLSDMLAGIASESDWLAEGNDPRFMSEVALRLQPPG